MGDNTAVISPRTSVRPLSQASGMVNKTFPVENVDKQTTGNVPSKRGDPHDIEDELRGPSTLISDTLLQEPEEQAAKI